MLTNRRIRLMLAAFVTLCKEHIMLILSCAISVTVLDMLNPIFSFACLSQKSACYSILGHKKNHRGNFLP
jgi:hypothetical protein